MTSTISPLSPKVMPMLNEHDSFPGLAEYTHIPQNSDLKKNVRRVRGWNEGGTVLYERHAKKTI